MKTKTVVGLIELDELASALRNAGIEVQGGGAFAQAGQDIISAFNSGQRIPIIVADTDVPGLRPWVSQIAESNLARVVIVHPGQAPEHLNIPASAWVSLPASLDEILSAAEVDTIGGAEGQEIYPRHEAAALPALPSIPIPEPEPEVPAPEVPAQTNRAPEPQPEPVEETLPQQRLAPRPPASPAPAAVPQPINTQAADDEDTESDIVFGTINRAGSGCPVIIVTSGRGGVGKSTTAIQLATLAGMSGMRTMLIDANVGQADITKYLGVPRESIPSITTMASTGKVQDSVTTEEQLTAARGRHSLSPFALIAGPDAEDRSQGYVTTETYLSAITWARQRADIVIVDTQITESHDRTGMVDELVIPVLLTNGAWLVGVTDMTNPGINNLMHRVKMFNVDHQVPKNRMLLFLNKVDEVVKEQADVMAERGLSRKGVYLGTVLNDPQVPHRMNIGETDLEGTSLHQVVASILYRVTGMEEFEWALHPEPESRTKRGRAPMPTHQPTRPGATTAQPQPEPKRGFLARFFRGRGK